MTTKNILVTGGAGFIGSNLIRRLLEQGNSVVCLDNLSTGSEENIKDLRENFTFVPGDVNTEDIQQVFKKHQFDQIYHLSAVVGVKRTLEHPAAVLKDIEGIKNIFTLAKKHNVKKVLYASSSEVYGEPVKLPEAEDGPISPKLPYAAVKLIGEKYCEAYYQEHGIKATALRFFNTYGPRQIDTAYGFVVGIFINQVLNNQQPTIFGSGEQTRDFVYIEDNNNFMMEAMQSDKTNGQVINIGTGNAITIKKLAEEVIALRNKELKLKFLAEREKDIVHRCPDISKMEKLLKYRPKFQLKEGLKKTMMWYENRTK
jgi:UDP-glucuronate decarboxylase